PQAPCLLSSRSRHAWHRRRNASRIPDRLLTPSHQEEGRGGLRRTSPIIRATSRRRFLQYLAGSPLLASGALSAYGTEAPSKLPDPMIWTSAGRELNET